MAVNDTSLQVEDLKDMNMFPWLLSPDENTQVNQWVLGFREDRRMLALPMELMERRLAVGLPRTPLTTHTT